MIKWERVELPIMGIVLKSTAIVGGDYDNLSSWVAKCD